MASVESKTKYLCGFYRPKENDPRLLERASKLIAWLREKAETYAVIVHDLDTDEDGERVTPHIHMVATMLECRKIKSNINEIAQLLEVSELSVTLDKASSVTRSVRYLIHKDNPEKHQYPLTEIVNNWNEKEFLDVFKERNKEEVTFEFVLALCQRARNITDVISTLGMGAYRYWRPVISDIWTDLHGKK